MIYKSYINYMILYNHIILWATIFGDPVAMATPNHVINNISRDLILLFWLDNKFYLIFIKYFNLNKGSFFIIRGVGNVKNQHLTFMIGEWEVRRTSKHLIHFQQMVTKIILPIYIFFGIKWSTIKSLVCLIDRINHLCMHIKIVLWEYSRFVTIDFLWY